MRILLTAPTAFEVNPTDLPSGSWTFVESGVGVPATLFRLQEAWQANPFDLLIQAGVAGSFNPNYSPGAVGWVEHDQFEGLGLSQAGVFTPLAESYLNRGSYPNEPNGWIRASLPEGFIPDLPAWRGLTVAEVTDNPITAENRQRQTGADIETMEGAAAHYLGFRLGIPVLQIRAISNQVGNRDVTTWKLAEAIEALHQQLGFLLPRLAQ